MGAMDPGVAVGSGVTGLGVTEGVAAGLIVYGAGVDVGLGVGVGVGVGVGAGVTGPDVGFAIVVIFAGFSVADAISSLCFMYLK